MFQLLYPRLTAIFPLESLNNFMSPEYEFAGHLILIQNLLQVAP